MATMIIIALNLLFMNSISGKVNINVDIQRVDRQLNSLRIKCESSVASDAPLEEQKNAIYECVSAACFSEVYGETPLEDGEVDTARYRLFTICARKEIKLENSKLNKQRLLIVE